MPAIRTRLAAKECIRLLLGREHARGDFEQALAIGAEADTAWLSLKEIETAMGLEFADMGREGGLADRHAARGLRKRAGLRDDMKGSQLGDRHMIRSAAFDCRHLAAPHIIVGKADRHVTSAHVLHADQDGRHRHSLPEGAHFRRSPIPAFRLPLSPPAVRR